MIKGTDRKEGAKIIQFRAPSEYNSMIELITTALNRSMAEVGSKEKITFTDVMKLAIESLAKGNNDFDILGKNIKINELVNNELEYFNKEYFEIIPDEVIQFEVKTYLFEKIKEIIKRFGSIYINFDLGNSSELEEAKILNAIILSRCDYFESMEDLHIEKETIKLVKIESIAYYLYLIIRKYEELKLKVEEIDYEIFKSEIENNILRYSKLKNMSAMKLYDNYKYSFILNCLRNDINKYVEYIKEYITQMNDPFIENERDKARKELCDLESDIEDEIYYYDYPMYKSEYDLRPGDPGYEFSIAEAIDNMYDK